MRFLRKSKGIKTIIVISDCHLGAGPEIDGKKNKLEDFYYDSDLVDLLDYYCSGQYSSKEVELIINGDFIDLLAVPYVEYFDDEFWSEKASLEKLNLVIEAHPEVFEAFDNFLQKKNKHITYVVGNHDAELVFESLQKRIRECLSDENQEKFKFSITDNDEYQPYHGVLVKHGHKFEVAHDFDIHDSVMEDEKGEQYFIPPWGAYYVTRVLNKFKKDREHIDSVRPIRKFLTHGLIYDTLLTIRFLIATISYFIVVRMINIFRVQKGKRWIPIIKKELDLFKDYEQELDRYLTHQRDAKIVIVGHTHIPFYRVLENGTILINTGTWKKVYSLDFSLNNPNNHRTFAQIDLNENGKYERVNLYTWKGRNNDPFEEY